MSQLVARARGLETSILTRDALAELASAKNPAALAAALARAGLPTETQADALDATARGRIARDLAVLARWSGELAAAPDRRRTARRLVRAPLAPLQLDEDRRSLRAIVRGLAANLPPTRRLAGTIATPSLSAAALSALAAASDVAGIHRVLVGQHHPFAAAFADQALDPLAIELALARGYGELARPRDRAMRVHVRQVIDTENTEAALLIAARGRALPDAFVPGGELIDRETFDAAVAEPLEGARARLAEALSETPLAAALFDPAPGALDDAALAWQLATQTTLRRLEPLGLAPVIHAVLRRRDEARRLRRAGWRIALGGGG